jgi:hypothetical protein
MITFLDHSAWLKSIDRIVFYLVIISEKADKFYRNWTNKCIFYRSGEFHRRKLARFRKGKYLRKRKRASLAQFSTENC